MLDPTFVKRAHNFGLLRFPWERPFVIQIKADWRQGRHSLSGEYKVTGCGVLDCLFVWVRNRGQMYERLLHLSKLLVYALGSEEWSYYDGRWEMLAEA